jgi:hypothetical protein
LANTLVDYLPWEFGVDVQRYGVREEGYAEEDVADDEAGGGGGGEKVGARGDIDSEVEECDGDGGEEAAGWAAAELAVHVDVWMLMGSFEDVRLPWLRVKSESVGLLE